MSCSITIAPVIDAVMMAATAAVRHRARATMTLAFIL
jgi:hypothetical protein